MKGPGVMGKIQGAKTMKEMATLFMHLAPDIGQEHIQLLGEGDMSPSEYQWLSQTYLGTLAKAEANVTRRNLRTQWTTVSRGA